MEANVIAPTNAFDETKLQNLLNLQPGDVLQFLQGRNFLMKIQLHWVNSDN